MPRRPVRRAFRWVFRMIGTAIAVALDLERREPAPPPTRPARDVRRGA
ncbi:hypothetical protein ACTG9Q_18890 [Actinokineospora sp. 24-640]